ncbi:MAG: hypothetical protein WA705_09235 [Candidatus Ozemobacteraceae bacterium]
MTTVTTFDPRKTLVQIPTIEKSVDDFFNVRTPETEFFGKLFVVNPDEFLEEILGTTIPARGLWVSRSIDSRRLAPAAIFRGCVMRHRLTESG